ncbi:hypothetical protein PTTG_27171 [Puccinia triticina 1-1 BBBD Race 1]|uniref:RING-type domain-containing protein n=2 Tax=Puccinia triticina TaxID=208348 RepID=A0A180GN32_PUCT1|nr:uncharacterized protein PtA15_16A277 [Puccinia triticina]OAV93829.1 hypothetical protein PTTG_27171 [Puccinia triticina 1-1 BBBD Race 1]WAQ92370.1 hypothetical protein PtA15_16A277 [Puccinia triticina]WAR64107.1 hypothetical protein PtB15_16B267 [Puccinia triticina]
MAWVGQVLLAGWFHFGLCVSPTFDWRQTTRVCYTLDFNPEKSAGKWPRTVALIKAKWTAMVGRPTKSKGSHGENQHACPLCEQHYEPGADKVAILRGCPHHFHPTCLEENFNKQVKGRRRINRLPFIVVSCPQLGCRYLYRMYWPNEKPSWLKLFFTKLKDSLKRLFGIKSTPYRPPKRTPLAVDSVKL